MLNGDTEMQQLSIHTNYFFVFLLTRQFENHTHLRD